MPSCKKPNYINVYMLIVNLMEKVLDFVQCGGPSVRCRRMAVGTDTFSVESPGRSKIGEVVGVQFLDLVGYFGNHSDAVLDHEISQFLAGYQTYELVAQ